LRDDRGVIFDMDGVLIDSEPIHCRAFQDVLAAYAVTLTERQYFESYLVYSDREVLERLLPAGQSLDVAVAAKERRYLTLLAAGIPAFPDGVALLAKCDGWRVGLATGSNRREAELALRTLGICQRFACIVAREDYDKGKPDPEPYLRAAQGLGLSPRRCVVIEDTPGGLRAARAAGMVAVAVTHSCPREHLGEADLVVEDLAAVDLGVLLSDGGSS
jgi:HAD superfamily hydrolase (TIGR01509 family)